ncbi:hypothetical protein ACFPOE_11465 [Caenimonas terrae]|uniref:Uncharacterized protein n=1 Tax=Caenimonas terrae TaxID=696074 RepID=A0ABW0NBW5_9BURK
MDINWLQLATLAIALIGAVLGLINTWRALSNDRVRVRVTPSWNLFNTGQESIGIEVVNLSSFAVTVTSIGFTKRGTGEHAMIVRPMLSSGDGLPKRLEPRTSFTAFAMPDALESISGKLDRAYVNTGCGLRITSKRKPLEVALHNLALARRN